MDLAFMWNILPSILEKLPITLVIFALSLVIALVVSVLLTILRLKRIPVINQIVEVFISFLISNPGIIHIFVVYYGIPMLLAPFGINVNAIDKIYFAIIALAIYNAGFMSQILKPSYEAVSDDQMEAALSIGYTERQANWRIVFPQVLPIALPSMSNAIVELFKDTSIVFLIGIVDMMGQADIIIANNLGLYQLEVYVVIGLIYWAISSILTFATGRLEKYTAQYVE